MIAVVRSCLVLAALLCSVAATAVPARVQTLEGAVVGRSLPTHREFKVGWLPENHIPCSTARPLDTKHTIVGHSIRRAASGWATLAATGATRGVAHGAQRDNAAARLSAALRAAGARVPGGDE